VGIGIWPFTAMALLGFPVKLTIVSRIYRSYRTVFCAKTEVNASNSTGSKEKFLPTAIGVIMLEICIKVEEIRKPIGQSVQTSTNRLSTDETITSRFGGPNLLPFCVARQLRSPTMRLSRALTDTKFLTSKS
jgi:hypothetical protein